MVKHCFDGEEYFVLPGGGHEIGETPEQAAVRELSEECNVNGDIIRKVSEYSDPYEDIYFWTYLMDSEELSTWSREVSLPKKGV